MPLSLAHHHYGPDTATNTLVILHGLFGSSSNWRSFARKYGEQHHVITVDARNHGESPWDDAMTYDVMSQDLIELIKQQGRGDVSVMGHSMGGKTAMHAAFSTPELVKRLIVVDIAPIAYDHSHTSYIEAMLAIDLVNVHARAEVDKLLSNEIAETGVRQFLLQNLTKENHQYKWRLNLNAIQYNLSHLIGWQHDSAHTMSNTSFANRALFIRGENSDYINQHGEQVISQLFPQHELKTVKNAGHWLHAENPKEFYTTVEQFLAQ